MSVRVESGGAGHGNSFHRWQGCSSMLRAEGVVIAQLPGWILDPKKTMAPSLVILGFLWL